jgi:hypothetical protein
LRKWKPTRLMIFMKCLLWPETVLSTLHVIFLYFPWQSNEKHSSSCEETELKERQVAVLKLCMASRKPGVLSQASHVSSRLCIHFLSYCKESFKPVLKRPCNQCKEVRLSSQHNKKAQKDFKPGW